MLFLIFISLELIAQSAQANSGILWTNIHLTKTLPKNFSTKIKFSYFDINPVTSARFIDFGGLYQTKNKISVGLYYRFNGDFDLNPYRTYIEATHKNLIVKKLSIQIMPRLRIQYKGEIDDNGEFNSSFQLRPRIMIRKLAEKNRNIILYASIETFYETESDVFMNCRRVRSDIGMRYRLPKKEMNPKKIKQEIGVCMRDQADFDQAQLVRLNTISLSYYFVF